MFELGLSSLQFEISMVLFKVILLSSITLDMCTLKVHLKFIISTREHHNIAYTCSSWYHKGHVFQSPWSLIIFQGFLYNCISCFITARITFPCILYPQCIHTVWSISYTHLNIACVPMFKFNENQLTLRIGVSDFPVGPKVSRVAEYLRVMVIQALAAPTVIAAHNRWQIRDQVEGGRGVGQAHEKHPSMFF